MAYADYAYYVDEFMGTLLPEAEAEAWLERAADEIDTLTMHRLQRFGLPTDCYYAARIKKANCAIAEALYQISVEAKAESASVAKDGTVRGAVASISSGRESISYRAGGSSAYGKAATSDAERAILLGGIVSRYLANVPDARGINLLYRGARGYV